MSTRSKQNGRRGRRRNRPPRLDSPRPLDYEMVPCGICREPVKDIYSALSHPEDGIAVHFDCALKDAEKKLKPENDEKIIYHGNGCFAVIAAYPSNRNKLKILRRIDWEKLDESPDWRKKLQTDIL